MNILTFDIEEWSIEKDFFGGHKEKYAMFDKFLDHILEQLNTYKIHATFFCLGKVALDFPYVIKKIDAEGHEIGSHSFAHKWVNKMTPDDFRDDTQRAVESIENLTGKKVKSFRAPAFSISDKNKWAFEILSEFGIENDASIFPGCRDFGGFPSFTEQMPCIVEVNNIRINEFPIPLYSMPIFNKEIAYSGGGYFRLFPQSFIFRQMKKSDYNMCYFHIDDLITEKSPLKSKVDFEAYYKESGTISKRLSRYFKANVGRDSAIKKFDKLIQSFEFISIESFLKNCICRKTINI